MKELVTGKCHEESCDVFKDYPNSQNITTGAINKRFLYY